MNLFNIFAPLFCFARKLIAGTEQFTLVSTILVILFPIKLTFPKFCLSEL